jgi:hypothetical protein
VYRRHFKKSAPQSGKDLFGLRAVVPCDLLVLRVCFDAWMPSVVKYKESDKADAILVLSDKPSYDIATREARKEIQRVTSIFSI